MLIPPRYKFNQKISFLLQKIEASKEVIDNLAIPPHIEMNIRRNSILKSSLFSARIEGNPLNLEDLNNKSSTELQKLEVFNILKTLNFVHERDFINFSTKIVLHFHNKIMTGITDKKHLGVFRKEVSAIFDSSGIAVYMPPPPNDVPILIERLLKYINSDEEQFVPIRAVLSHYIFEKIHPFLDGNGRVGRILLQAVLEKNGYGMKQLLTIEEYLESNRRKYYVMLDEPENDVTDYMEFMLEAIVQTADQAKNLVLNKRESNPMDLLLPRRAEILRIIIDHKLVNFDMVRRRFLKVNERTLRYDLKNLQDKGLIRKRGATKSVYYEAV